MSSNIGSLRSFRTPLAALQYAAPLAALAVAACGSAGESQGQTPLASDEPIAREDSALLLGATNLTNGILFSSAWQSETDAAVMGNVTVVAYNAEDTAHSSGGVCRLTAREAISYNSNGNWRALRMPMPPGMSLLMGHPSIAWLDQGASYRVYVSSLAVSDATFNAYPKNAQGCVAEATVNGPGLQACVNAIDIAKNGAGASFAGSACASTGSDRFSGGALATSAGAIYAAYWNMTRARIDAFGTNAQAFQVLATPFSGKVITGDPVVPRNSNGLELVAPDGSGNLWYSAYTLATNSWSAPRLVATGFTPRQTITINGTQLQERGLSAAWLTGVPAPATLFVSFAAIDANGIGIHTANCSQLTSAPCSANAFVTPAGSIAAFPSLFGVRTHPAGAMFPNINMYLSYWSNRNSVGANSSSTLFPTFVRLSGAAAVPTNFQAGQTICASSQSFFGTYDQMVVENDDTPNPRLFRPLTDMTGSSCSTTPTQHVSAFTIIPP